jgi:uncharacterized DUF497 family protein
MDYDWDPEKAEANFKKHGVHFADAVLALEDPLGLTSPDPDASGEARFVNLGADPSGRVLVTIFTTRGSKTRAISSRKASRAERRKYEAKR